MLKKGDLTKSKQIQGFIVISKETKGSREIIKGKKNRNEVCSRIFFSFSFSFFSFYFWFMNTNEQSKPSRRK